MVPETEDFTGCSGAEGKRRCSFFGDGFETPGSADDREQCPDEARNNGQQEALSDGELGAEGKLFGGCDGHSSQFYGGQEKSVELALSHPRGAPQVCGFFGNVPPVQRSWNLRVRAGSRRGPRRGIADTAGGVLPHRFGPLQYGLPARRSARRIPKFDASGPLQRSVGYSAAMISERRQCPQDRSPEQPKREGAFGQWRE